MNRVLTGSHFWGYNVEGSDKDYVEVVMPSKKDLWNGEFISKQEITDEIDIAHKDIRQVLKELKKGSVRIMESLYGEVVDDIDENFHLLRAERDFLVEDLRGLLIGQAQNELRAHWRRYQSFRSSNADKEMKDRIVLIKLSLIITALSKGQNPFISRLPILKAIREGKLGINWENLSLIIEPALEVDASQYNQSFDLLDAIEEDIMNDILY